MHGKMAKFQSEIVHFQAKESETLSNLSQFSRKISRISSNNCLYREQQNDKIIHCELMLTSLA